MNDPPRDKPITGAEIVAVACATCRRPEPLGRLLDSFLELRAPDGTQMVFIIVDNGDPSSGAEAQVAAFAERTPHRVVFAREARRGIPHARNRILETAIETGARWLVMLDDDEAATRDWAANMVAGLRNRGYALAGGPQSPVADHEPRGRIAKLVLDAVVRDARNESAWRATAVRDGRFPGHVWTSNCGIDLDVLRRTELRYDLACAESGGSDAMFSIAMKDLGGTIGWIPDAEVVEYLDPARLTLGFHRRLWHHLVLLTAVRQPQGRLGHLRDAAGHGGLMLWHLLCTPFGRRNLLVAAKYAGRMSGSLTAARGGTTRRYAADEEAR